MTGIKTGKREEGGVDYGGIMRGPIVNRAGLRAACYTIWCITTALSEPVATILPLPQCLVLTRWRLWCQTAVLLRGRLEAGDTASSPTENSSLNKYTNLAPCCYGNLLVEFHHRHSDLPVGHTPTSPWLAERRPQRPPWLVTCSLSASLRSSSRLISSSLRWGPFSCCLTISRSFLCCWEREGGDREKRDERRCEVCAADSLLTGKACLFFILCKDLEKGNKGSGSAG